MDDQRKERIAWMTLVYADMLQEVAVRHAAKNESFDREDLLMRMEVATQARIRLRDEFGINLDTLDYHARNKYEVMCEEWHKQRAVKKERDRSLDAALAIIKNSK